MRSLKEGKELKAGSREKAGAAGGRRRQHVPFLGGGAATGGRVARVRALVSKVSIPGLELWELFYNVS